MVEGYIYVLANSSMPDIVNVGRTSWSPAVKARELSDTTAVPTPFLVVYEAYFGDSVEAESHIHTMLQHRGYSVPDTREFFNAPIPEVVQVINELVQQSDEKGRSPDDQNEQVAPKMRRADRFERSFNVDGDDAVVEPWTDAWDQANRAYYGLEDSPIDDVLARKLFIKAAELGCPYAPRELGDIYYYGRGVGEEQEKALDYYEEGSDRGDYISYLSMAHLFLRRGDSDNVKKCFHAFTDARMLRKDVDIDGEIPNEFCRIFSDFDLEGLKIPRICRPVLVEYREDILELMTITEERWREGSSDDTSSRTIDRLQYMAKILKSWH